MDCSSPTYPVARKPHQCFLCYLPIDVGERYSRSACFNDGTAYTIEEHIECQRYATAEVPPDEAYGGWVSGCVAEHLEDAIVEREWDPRGYYGQGATLLTEPMGEILAKYPGLQRQVDALRVDVAKRNRR